MPTPDFQSFGRSAASRQAATTRQAHRNAAWAATGVVFVLLLPFWFDTLAMGGFLIWRSPQVYERLLLGFEITAVVGALAFGYRGWQVLRRAYGLSVLGPAVLYGCALAGILLAGSGNQEFVLASMRYAPWLLFLAGVLAAAERVTSLELVIRRLRVVAVALAVLACIQWAASPWLADALGAIHGLIMPEGRTNAVLTSLGLGKSFASLSARSPIELGYVGLIVLVIGLRHRNDPTLVLCGFALIAAGRSNATMLAALLVLTLHATGQNRWSLTQRLLVAGAGVAGLLACFALLPTIYMGAGANWGDVIETLSMQRLGILIALPAIIDDAGFGLLLRGVTIALEPLVETLYQAGLLPELFAEGGAIAVFDVQWFGMLLVGGLPFVAGGAWLLLLAIRRTGAPASEARLYALAALIISMSSQIMLSRYGLFFLCFTIAAAATGLFPRGARSPS
jgi:hypothetical protein